MSGVVTLNGGRRPQPTRWNVLYAGDVEPSPSRRFARTPFLPTRAVYGPPIGSQQPSSPRAQVLVVAYVDRPVAARTVISCREAASAGVARSFARFVGHVATAIVASWTARSIGARYRPFARHRVRSNG